MGYPIAGRKHLTHMRIYLKLFLPPLLDCFVSGLARLHLRVQMLQRKLKSRRGKLGLRGLGLANLIVLMRMLRRKLGWQGSHLLRRLILWRKIKGKLGPSGFHSPSLVPNHKRTAKKKLSRRLLRWRRLEEEHEPFSNFVQQQELLKMYSLLLLRNG